MPAIGNHRVSYGRGHGCPKNSCPTSFINIGPQISLQKGLEAPSPSIFSPLLFAYSTSTCSACLPWLSANETSSSLALVLTRSPTSLTRLLDAFSLVAIRVRRIPLPSSTCATPTVRNCLRQSPIGPPISA